MGKKMLTGYGPVDSGIALSPPQTAQLLHVKDLPIQLMFEGRTYVLDTTDILSCPDYRAIAGRELALRRVF